MQMACRCLDWESARGWRLVTVLLVLWLVLFSMCSAASAKEPVLSDSQRQTLAVIDKAKILLVKGKIVEADLAFQSAVKITPKWHVVYREQAKYYSAIKNYLLAADCWEKASNLQPGNIQYREKLAECLTEAAEYERARKAWLYLAEQHPHSANLRYKLAYIAFREDDLAMADKYIMEAFDRDPGNTRFNVLKAQIDVRQGKYTAALNRINESLTNIPDNVPLRKEAEQVLAKAQDGVTKQRYYMIGMIVLPIVLAIAGFTVYRYTRKVAFKSAPAELDAATEDAVCRYVLTHVSNLASLPRGLCWSVSLDGRRLELQVSELIGEQTALARSQIDRKALKEWLDNHGRAPFLFKAESREELFTRAFPNLVEDLEGVEINVGVPIVWKGTLLGLALLGRSRSSKKGESKRHFEDNADKILEVSETAAVALDRLRLKNLKVFDSVTGLWNRDYFESALVKILKGCQTADIPMAVYMVRMDQITKVLDNSDVDMVQDVIYAVSQAVQKALAGEVNVTLCHMDDGLLSLIAPGRNEEQAYELAKSIKRCVDNARLPDRDIRPTGLVAYTVYPFDADEPKMLRSILGRAFRDAVYLDGNRIVRSEKVENSVEYVEKKADEPEDLVVARRAGRHGERSESVAPKPYMPFDPEIGRKLANDNEEDFAGPLGSFGSEMTILGSAPLTVSTGASSRSGSEATSSIPKQVSAPASRSVIVAPAAAAAPAAAPARLDLPTSKSAGSSSGEFTIVPDVDEYGVDLDTQFCSQEAFEELVNYEVSLAEESGESCAVVYLRLHNLKQMRSFGKEAYMQLRRDLSALVCAFLRDEIDVPGLIGQDDFAVFLIGTDLSVASNLADRVNITAKNLDIQGTYVELSIGVAIQAGTGLDGLSLIRRAGEAAREPGINMSKVK